MWFACSDSVPVDADLWNVVEEALTGVLTLSEGLSEAEWVAARLTRLEVRRQLLQAAAALQKVPAPERAAIPELSWQDWERCAADLERGHGSAYDAAMTWCISSLVPETAGWLRIYRTRPPSP